jgi:hypothetical protein
MDCAETTGAAFFTGVLFIFCCFAIALGFKSFCIEETSLSFLMRIIGSCLILMTIAGEDSIMGLDEGPSCFMGPVSGFYYGVDPVGLAKIT